MRASRITSASELAKLANHRAEQMAERQARVTRTLQLVRVGHGLLTTRWITRRTGWSQRSAERYLNDLWVAGLVDRQCRADGCAHRWRITESGRAQLTGALAA